MAFRYIDEQKGRESNEWDNNLRRTCKKEKFGILNEVEGKQGIGVLEVK